MDSRHLVHRAAQASYQAPPGWSDVATGYRRWTVVGEGSGSVHTGFGICELEPGGMVPAHVHSFEESFHVLDGSAIIETSDGSYRVGPGDYGLIPVGVPHAWRVDASADSVVRWAEMQGPQPRSRTGEDTFLVPPLPKHDPIPVDVRDPRTRGLGTISPAHMDPTKQSQDLLAVSASMRTALLVYSGITVKMMVDSDLGAQLTSMFMVQYEPEGVAGAHDHPFEETYLILEGAVEASFDGERHVLQPGDVAWAGVGCVHSFKNVGDGRVRWLETQAPQPPPRHSYRFARDWDYLREQLATHAEGSMP
ncbi:cupin domain-containing protein [Actinobacteria bacterium YIM 96077]|uniref:Cupin domain-containing protein n=1 Tax=Phytoactinopolyspora halophila TaxID=1981511 RepID=A0A329QZ67_9ACTN|nr:cupin domain-containing protein [Phytoactinopolyspora halophila]AYY13190.1 cupin domain-containing protein [Actinobacteria bacterium YIM 96077]RAW17571.1 cupin domain-containing protein [Phytoactinopolyspora halophila]